VSRPHESAEARWRRRLFAVSTLASAALAATVLGATLGSVGRMADAPPTSRPADSRVSSQRLVSQPHGGSPAVQFRSPGRRSRPDRDSFPTWELPGPFENDAFTFVRVRYDSYGSFGWWSRWDNDYPDSDWNFSFRLHQLTSLRVNPDSKVLRLTDPELRDYPFIYMAGVGKMVLSRAERESLRDYLSAGGFLMMDDFWTPKGWRHVAGEMGKVFPGREPRQLTIDHEIFHLVYDLKELPQVVDIRTWRSGYLFEHGHGDSGGDEDPHFWAYFDDSGRMMALLCHNNDLGDGWEREGENSDYFDRFSVRISYPFGINVVTYAMTH
jgi:hypothetical protein